MGLFDWLKPKQKPARREPDKAPGMIVLLDALPDFDNNAIAEALGAIEPLRVAPKIDIEQTSDDDDNVQGSADFDSHSIGIVGFDAPAPDAVIEKTIKVSNWTGEGREQLESHKAHLVLMHKGGGADVLEKYIALYKLAGVIGGEHLRGVLLEEAWTCAPPDVVREFLSSESLKGFRKNLPPILFTGFVKFFSDEGTWFATKGHHMFGTPDLVMFGDEKPADVMDIFMNIFLYVTQQGARIGPGHTLQIADEVFLKFSELDPANPYIEYLKGAGPTLQLSRISQDEIKRKDGA
ncbi:MAG: DUF4261 domain-containing protein [Planctomycetes bacterium]|nr:DUF4261 domain-containing protein [Planctomycetota bacterium]